MSFESSAVETWSRLGDCSLTLDNFTIAFTCFNNSLKFNQLHLPALIGLIKSSIGADSSQGALSNTSSCLNFLNVYLGNHTSDSLFESPEFVINLAQLYYTLSQFETGINLLNNFLNKNNKNPAFFLWLGKCYAKMNKKNDGYNLLLNGLNLTSANDSGLRRSFHLELGKYHYDDGQLDKATEQFNLGLSLPFEEKDFSQLYLFLVLSYVKKHDSKSAMTCCNSANLFINQNYQLLLLKAYVLTEFNPQESIEILNQLVDDKSFKSSEDFLPWYLLGKNYSLLKSFRSAYDCFQVSLRKSSNFPLTWLAIGKLYLDLKQLPDALAAYSQALRLQPEEVSLGSAIAWDGLSCVYERCENQLMDASDACMRSANCFKLMGNMENFNNLSNRSNYLKSYNSPQPLDVRDPCPIPESLITDMIEMTTQERISYIQNQSHGFKTEEQPSQHQVLTNGQTRPSPSIKAGVTQNRLTSPQGSLHQPQPIMPPAQHTPQPQHQPPQPPQSQPQSQLNTPGAGPSGAPPMAKPRLPSYSGSHSPSSVQSPVRPMAQHVQYSPSQFPHQPQGSPHQIVYHSVPFVEGSQLPNGPPVNGNYPMVPIGMPIMGHPSQPPPPPGYYGQYVPNGYVSYNRRR